MGWLFASPYLVFALVFFLIPLGWSFYLALTDWNLIAPRYNFIGFSNFVAALLSPSVHSAFFVTYRFLLVFVPSVVVTSLIIAVSINSLPKFKGLFLTGFFLPYLASGVVASLIINNVLAYNSGFNIFLRQSLNLDINWLGSPVSALLVVAFIINWRFTGYYALIISAGLDSIDRPIYEAAAIDGVTGIRRFFSITLPNIYPSLYTTMILAIGVSFGIFTEIFQLTGGGPNFATNTWQMEIYTQAFRNMQAGYASAVALIAAVVTFISIYIIRKVLEIWGRKNGW